MKEIRKKVGRLPVKVIFELVIRVIDNIEIDKSDLQISQDQLVVCKDLGLTCQICSSANLRDIQN